MSSAAFQKVHKHSVSLIFLEGGGKVIPDIDTLQFLHSVKAVLKGAGRGQPSVKEEWVDFSLLPRKMPAGSYYRS